jgi:anti-sigma factor RsiW
MSDHDAMSDQDAKPDEDEMISKLCDYLDGTLPASERAGIADKIENDEAWKTAHAEIIGTRNALSGMQKARAPASFAQDVTTTIHKRSAGRFFARRTLGDRVPFGALVVLAVLGLIVVAYVLWASQTGSLKSDRDHATKPPAENMTLPKP